MIALVVVLAAALGLARGRDSPPSASTMCGPVQGVWDRPGLAAFLGIPFAQAPVGPLRWMPPYNSTCWPFNMTFQATKQPPACPQLSLKTSAGQSEDCLYLNVFTTQLGASRGVPVLVWIYGGGSVDGSMTDYGNIQNIVESLNGQVVLGALAHSVGVLVLRVAFVSAVISSIRRTLLICLFCESTFLKS
jgi:para-nitrobenzyl esterase